MGSNQSHFNIPFTLRGKATRWCPQTTIFEEKGVSKGGTELTLSTHLPSATVRVYTLVAPCHLPDLTSLALLGSVSGQHRLSRGPLPGYKMVSKWQLQLQDSTPFPLLSQRFCTTLHTSASLGCYLLFTLMPDCPLASLPQV